MKSAFAICLLIAIALSGSVTANSPPGHGGAQVRQTIECPHFSYIAAPVLIEVSSVVYHLPAEARAQSGTYISRYDARVRRSNKHQFVVYLPDKYRKGNKDINTSITKHPSAGSVKGDSRYGPGDAECPTDEVEA